MSTHKLATMTAKIGCIFCVFAVSLSAQTWKEPTDKDGLYQWLADKDHIKRALAANVIWDKFPEERERLHAALDEMLRSPNKDKRVDAALLLRRRYADEEEPLRKIMRTDPEVDVRIRLAYRFLLDYKDEQAKPVLKEVLRTADIRTHAGAESFLRAAGGLQEGAGEVEGLEKALSILSADPNSFPDLASSPYEYSLRGTVKLMAIGFLLSNRAQVPAEKLSAGLRFHLKEAQDRIGRSKSEKEREYWEGHLPSTLDLLLRNDMKGIVVESAGAAELIKNKHHKDWMMSVIKKARGEHK